MPAWHYLFWRCNEIHSANATKFTAVCTLLTCLPFSIRLQFVPVSPNHAYSLNLFPIQTNCTKYAYIDLLHNFAVPPSIHRGPSNKTVNETNDLELCCNASGNPSPNIKWSKVANPSMNLASDEVLKVQNVSKNDSGDYQCMARNGIGRDALAYWIVTVNCKSESSIKDRQHLH